MDTHYWMHKMDNHRSTGSLARVWNVLPIAFLFLFASSLNAQESVGDPDEKTRIEQLLRIKIDDGHTGSIVAGNILMEYLKMSRATNKLDEYQFYSSMGYDHKYVIAFQTFGFSVEDQAMHQGENPILVGFVNLSSGKVESFAECTKLATCEKYHEMLSKAFPDVDWSIKGLQ